MDDKPTDTFDDLFEPFGLEDESRPDRARESAGEAFPEAGENLADEGEGILTCASCGSANESTNRHCERCGARLAPARQMPVAPQPMLRTTAGARALIVLATVVLAVAVLALVFNVFTGDGEGTPAEAGDQTGTTAATVPISQLTPIRVECSSQLPQFPCTALIDNDPETSWNATESGLDAEITFLFSPPVQITEMIIENVEDPGRFLRNARMRGIEVKIDDLVQTTVVELADTNLEPHRVEIRSLGTSSLTIRINSAYPGQSHEGNEPFPELAVQDILFFGRPTPGE